MGAVLNDHHTPLSAQAAEPFHIFWTSGAVQCVLVITGEPTHCAVHLLNESGAFLAEACQNPAEAAVIADYLRTLVVDLSR